MPDDDREHAIVMQDQVGQETGIPVLDMMFNRQTGGVTFPAGVAADPQIPSSPVYILAAAYRPGSSQHYMAWPFDSNLVEWSAWSPFDQQPTPDPDRGTVCDFSIGWPAPGAIVDLAMFYSGRDDQMYVGTLFADGTIVTCHNNPWAGSNVDSWSIGGTITRASGASRITAVSGPDGVNHVFVAQPVSGGTEIIEHWFTPGEDFQGGDVLWTFPYEVTEFSAFFTADGKCHLLVASHLVGENTLLEDLSFTPAMGDTAVREVGRPARTVTSLSAYARPGWGSHTVFEEPTGSGRVVYLGWYDDFAGAPFEFVNYPTS